MGVLAHVDSPEAFVSRVASLLEPDGHLILEFTDATHPYGRWMRFFSKLRQVLAPARSSVNPFSAEGVAGLTERHGFRLVSEYRYCELAMPGLRLLGHRALYKVVRFVFGIARGNRNGRFGNEYIRLYRHVG
jgi:hypothetical protein